MKTYKAAKHYSLKVQDAEFNSVEIRSSKDAGAFARNFYFDDIEIYESFFILLLNRRNVAIGYAKISQGGTVGTVVDPKIIAKYAVDSLANSVILVHNHPSGSDSPSNEDLKVTHKIKNALSFLDVNVLDHIILTKNGYTSLADNGEL